MKEKYKIRHLILAHLFSKVEYDEKDAPMLGNTKTPLKEISSKINVDYDLVLKYHHGIYDKQAICMKNSNHEMVLLRDGYDAVIDEYWLREGEKELNERIYDKTKWLVPVFTLFISIGSLLYTIFTVSATNLKVSTLETQIKGLIIKLDLKNDIGNRASQIDTNSLETRMYYRLDSSVSTIRKK